MSGAEPAPARGPAQAGEWTPEEAEALVRRRLGKSRTWWRWALFVATLALVWFWAWSWVGHYRAVFEITFAGGTAEWIMGTPPWKAGHTRVGLAQVFWSTRRVSPSGPTASPLEPLLRLRRVEEVDLSNALALVEPDLAVLGQLKDLRILQLGTGVFWSQGFQNQTMPFGDTALGYLSGLPRLEDLNLSGTRVTDDGLRRYANFPRLAYLDLRDTGVTDACVPVLLALPRLEHVDLSGTQVTRAGLDRLMRERPELSVMNPLLEAGDPAHQGE